MTQNKKTGADALARLPVAQSASSPTGQMEHAPGDWQVRDDGTNAQIISPKAGNYAIALVYSGGRKYPYNHEQRANANLIAEAGTVATETGLTPRQLADQRVELLEACKFFMGALADGDLVRDISHDGDSGWALKMMAFVSDLGKAQLAINNAEGRQ